MTAELAQNLHSLADTIRTSFNDYAFVIVTGSDSTHIPGINRQQPMRIPSLEDIITLFGLEKGINWRTHMGVQEYSRRDGFTGGISGVKQEFRGFDDRENRIIDGESHKDFASDQPGIDNFESWTRKFYGTSQGGFLRRYTPNGSTLAFVLGYDIPIEAGEEPRYGFDLQYVNSEGKRVVTSYSGNLVRKTRFLSYWDRVENYGIYYHSPFFKREKEGLTKPEVENTYNLRETLATATKGSEDSDLLVLLRQEEARPEGEYHNLKSSLGLDQLPWFQRPDEITILRLDEMARFLEKLYRETHGLDEVYYRDYEEGIQVFRNQLWLLFRKQSPYGSVKQVGSRELYPPWTLKEPYPKGFGPFDPGPHNPGGPNDPRGPHPGGPDPRGPDPRGSR